MKEFFIKKNITIKQALLILNKVGRKCLIVTINNKILGSLSDGDLRKAITKGYSLNAKIDNIINRKPIYLEKGKFSNEDIKKYFSKYLVDVIPVIDQKKNVVELLFWEQSIKDINTDLNNKANKNIDVVIMAGGIGKRLEPFTTILPKPLIPVNGKTIVERIIDNFEKYGFLKYNFIVNYKSLILKAYLKELKSSNKIKYFEENKPLGTIGGLSLLKKNIKDNFILSNCDIIVDCNYSDLIEYHIKNSNLITLVVAAKEFSIPYGNCILNKKGDLKLIMEKPIVDYLINTGVYVINKKVINLIKKNENIDMDKLISRLLANKNKIGVFPIHENQWIDIGNWSEYKKTIENL